MASSLDLSKTYSSYSGVDIRVVINGRPVGSMQALSYAIQREKAPIYVMGSVDPISYSRGKRGIAGTMISLLLDKHFIYSDNFQDEKAYLDKDEIFDPVATSGRPGGENQNEARLNNLVGRELRNVANDLRPDGTRAAGYSTDDVSSNYAVAPVFYVDQILPFDVSIVAANEYGSSAQMRLYGCEILNEGSGFSIDDMVIENQMTYVCRTILPWRAFTAAGDGQSVKDQLYSNRQPKNPVS
jgi:hypothetical protein